MRGPGRRTAALLPRVVVPFVLASATVLAGCQASAASPGATAPAAAGRTYSLCPPSSGPIDEAVTDRAIEVLRQRLTRMGMTGATITAGTCIDVRVAGGIEDPALAPAVEGTGHVALLAVPPDRIGDAVVGGEAPPDAAVLAADPEFASFSVSSAGGGHSTLVLRPVPDAADIVAAWTTENVGGSMALALDGVVVALAPVTEPVSGDEVSIDLGAAPVIPVAAIDAMLGSGPLPDEWAQPQNPQG